MPKSEGMRFWFSGIHVENERRDIQSLLGKEPDPLRQQQNLDEIELPPLRIDSQ